MVEEILKDGDVNDVKMAIGVIHMTVVNCVTAMKLVQ